MQLVSGFLLEVSPWYLSAIYLIVRPAAQQRVQGNGAWLEMRKTCIGSTLAISVHVQTAARFSTWLVWWCHSEWLGLLQSNYWREVQWNYCQLSVEGNVVHHSISVLRHTRIQLLQTAMQGNMAAKVLEMSLLPSSYQFMLVHYVSHRVIANETNQHQLWHFTKTNQYISTLAFESWILETLSSDGELLPFDNISFTDLWEIAQWISLQGHTDAHAVNVNRPP